jgi:hypothetical protein
VILYQLYGIQSAQIYPTHGQPYLPAPGFQKLACSVREVEDIITDLWE